MAKRERTLSGRPKTPPPPAKRLSAEWEWVYAGERLSGSSSEPSGSGGGPSGSTREPSGSGGEPSGSGGEPSGSRGGAKWEPVEPSGSGGEPSGRERAASGVHRADRRDTLRAALGRDQAAVVAHRDRLVHVRRALVLRVDAHTCGRGNPAAPPVEDRDGAGTLAALRAASSQSPLGRRTGSPGADVAVGGASPVPAQMWAGMSPSPGADEGGVSPVPERMCQRGARPGAGAGVTLYPRLAAKGGGERRRHERRGLMR
jgi:hypothetical protein